MTAMEMLYLVLKTPEQLSFAIDVVIMVSDLAYFRGPSEYKVFAL